MKFSIHAEDLGKKIGCFYASEGFTRKHELTD